MAQKKPVRSLDSLATLISPEEKERLRIEQEKIDKQHKKTMEVIRGMDSSLVKKKIGEKAFNDMYDTLKVSGKNFHSGTDKEGDYIIVGKDKFIRTEEIPVKQ